MSFKYNKELLFKEFDDAKNKDISLSKKTTLDEKETDIYTNRIKFLFDHIELKNKHPEYYSEIDVNFDNLLKTYQTSNPRDSFYMSIFNMTYDQKMKQEELENSFWEELDKKQTKKIEVIEQEVVNVLN